MDILPASQRPPIKQARYGDCTAFRWIGQAFTSCDNCGHPYWEHSHYRTVRIHPVSGESRSFDKIIPEYKAKKAKRDWTGE